MSEFTGIVTMGIDFGFRKSYSVVSILDGGKVIRNVRVSGVKFRPRFFRGLMCKERRAAYERRYRNGAR